MYRLHFRRTVFWMLVGLVAAIGGGLLSPKVYEARVELLFGAEDARRITGDQDEVQRILQRGDQGSVETELAILRGESVFGKAVQAVFDKTHDQRLVENYENLFLMYDVKGAEQSRIGLVRVKAYDRDIAFDIAAQIVLAYNETRRKAIRSSVSDAQNYLAAQIVTSRSELDNAEQRLQDYKRTNKFSDFPTKTVEVTRYESQLVAQRDAAASQLDAVMAEITVQRAKIRQLPQKEVAIEVEQKTPAVQMYENELAEYQRQRIEALRLYNPTSTRVKNLDLIIKGVQQKLADEMKKPLLLATKQSNPEPVRAALSLKLADDQVREKSLRAQLRAIDGELGQQTTAQKKLADNERVLRGLARTMEIADARYRRLKTQADELESKAKTTPVYGMPVSDIVAPTNPVSPDFVKLTFVGLLGGMCFGLLYSFIIESLRLRVSTSAQLGNLTGLPVAATIPRLGGRQAAALLGRFADKEGKPTESFRFMASSYLAKQDSYPRVLMFTSAGPGGDAALSASQFALAVAQTGLRTLIIDADLYASKLTVAYDAANRSGVSDILTRTLLPSVGSDLLVSTPHPNLMLLPAGTEQGYSLADFETAHMTGLVDSAKERADVVVLVVPPCDVVADASRLGKHVDEVFLVVSARATQYQRVPVAYDILRRSGVQEVSLILADAQAEEEAFGRAHSFRS